MSELRAPASPGGPPRGPAFLRPLLVSVGVICVGLGVIGIFVPLLPTTPFLLVAAACFVRSSDRLYQRLISHRALGPYIRNYRERRAITRGVKIIALGLLWTTMGYAVVWLVSSLVIRFVLLTIATLVTVHLLRLKTLTDGEPPEGSTGSNEP